ncbi:MAG: hypothetical protein OXI96_05035 [Acidimicrobiaceae bacterium]|nr:hypothetical protein [Acidimicrobiaceae bacterium]
MTPNRWFGSPDPPPDVAAEMARDMTLERQKRSSGVGFVKPAKIVAARSSLVDALDSIASGSTEADNLEQALHTYRELTVSVLEGDMFWAYCELVDSLVHSVRWVNAVRSAEAEASRYADAARLRASEVSDRSQPTWPESLIATAQQLAELTEHRTPSLVAATLSRVPLPPRVTPLFKNTQSPFQSQADDDPPEEMPTAAIVVRFQGEPVMRPTILQPGAMHQFEVEARVKHWPEEADQLEVEFITLLPESYLYASDLNFTREALQQSLEVRVAGERLPSNPPLELTAHAAFLHADQRITARLTGNTTLELSTFDPETTTLKNMPIVARRVHQMMYELNNALPVMCTEDKQDVRLLLEGVLRFAHTVLDDRLDADVDVNEAWFQKELSFFLQADPNIGARLDKQASRAGGVTDLLLDRIVLELKVEKTRVISMQEARQRFVGQPTQYAAANDSQVSLVAVLDASKKPAPAGVMGNEIEWVYPEVVSGENPRFPAMVGIIIIRAGFPRPSDYSR